MPPTGVTAVVGLSADENDVPVSARTPRTADAAAPDIRLATLLVVGDHDPFVSVPDTRRLLKRIAVPDKELVVVPDSERHGWDLLPASTGNGWSSLDAALQAFLDRHL